MSDTPASLHLAIVGHLPPCDAVTCYDLNAGDPARLLLPNAGALDGVLIVVAAEEGTTQAHRDVLVLAARLGLPVRVLVRGAAAVEAECLDLLAEELRVLLAPDTPNPVLFPPVDPNGAPENIAEFFQEVLSSRPEPDASEQGFKPTPSRLLDARLALPDLSPLSLKHHERLRVYHGDAESIAKVVMLDRDTCSPGESSLVQLLLDTPLSARRGDVLAFRFLAPPRSLGTGRVLDPTPPSHRRRREAVLARLRDLESTPERAVVAALSLLPFGRAEELACRVNLPPDAIRAILQDLSARGEAVSFPQDRGVRWCEGDHAERIRETASAILRGFHAENPAAPGMTRSAFWTAVGDQVPAPLRPGVAAFLEREGSLCHVADGCLAAPPGATPDA